MLSPFLRELAALLYRQKTLPTIEEARMSTGISGKIWLRPRFCGALEEVLALANGHAHYCMNAGVSFPLALGSPFGYAIPKDCCEDQTHRYRLPRNMRSRLVVLHPKSRSVAHKICQKGQLFSRQALAALSLRTILSKNNTNMLSAELRMVPFHRLSNSRTQGPLLGMLLIMLYFFHRRLVVLTLVYCCYLLRRDKANSLGPLTHRGYRAQLLKGKDASHPSIFSHQLLHFLSHPI